MHATADSALWAVSVVASNALLRHLQKPSTCCLSGWTTQGDPLRGSPCHQVLYHRTCNQRTCCDTNTACTAPPLRFRFVHACMLSAPLLLLIGGKRRQRPVNRWYHGKTLDGPRIASRCTLAIASTVSREGYALMSWNSSTSAPRRAVALHFTCTRVSCEVDTEYKTVSQFRTCLIPSSSITSLQPAAGALVQIDAFRCHKAMTSFGNALCPVESTTRETSLTADSGSLGLRPKTPVTRGEMYYSGRHWQAQLLISKCNCQVSPFRTLRSLARARREAKAYAPHDLASTDVVPK